MAVGLRRELTVISVSVLVVAVLVVAGLTLVASTQTVPTRLGAARYGGEFRVMPGASVVLTGRRATFTDGTTTATFRVPRHRRTDLRLAADARAEGRSGYRAVVRFRRERTTLRVLRSSEGRVVLGRSLIPSFAERVRIQLQTDGAQIRARAFVPGDGAPPWQIELTDPVPLARSGKARAWISVSDAATSPIPVQGQMTYVDSAVDPTASSTSTPTGSPTVSGTATDLPTTPPQPSCPRLGVYNYWDADRDHEINRQFGATAELSTSYYQTTERVRMESEIARIGRGTSPNITFTTKGTQYLAALGTGRSHPQYDAASAWLTQHVTDLSTLADLSPSVPVYATLEHEFQTKLQTGEITGRSTDPVLYGRALNRFYRRVDAANPRIRTTYWMVGWDRVLEGRIAEEFTVLPKAILFDPYAHRTTDTLISIASADLRWIRAQDWYVGQEIGLAEFGMQVVLGDEALGTFFASLRGQLEVMGVSFAIFFNREKDFDTRIAERSDGKTFPRGQAAFARSLQEDDVC